jgi:pimeloyl-ACP methyl ester carboxylesterase
MSTQPGKLPGSNAPLRPAPATSRFLQAGGLRLHLLDYGAPGKQPVLCVHGGGAHAHWFDFVAPDLVADFHVQAIDLRGHGDSEWAGTADYSYARHAQDLHEAVAALGLDGFFLIGHSMGGMVALEYATTYPGRVARLVVADTTMRLSADRIANFHQIGAREPGRYASEEEYMQRFRLRPSASTASAAVIAHIARHAGRRADDGTWVHKFDRKVYASREYRDGVDYWDRIRIPALLVKGALSPRVSPAIQAEVKARCPQVQFAEVPGAEHHVTLDNPHGFVAAVRPFLSAD